MTTDRITRYDRSMLRLMNDRRGRPLYATATRRRLVVALHIALTVAIGALMTHTTTDGASWPTPTAP
ncbi:hypothetical protein [Streptomyces carpaticus]|uniref:Transposase n=1 Tax=Streptomyces carpaticus TaxID=285558 RepID=A0ABV4ZGU6_9ACTN